MIRLRRLRCPPTRVVQQDPTVRTVSHPRRPTPSQHPPPPVLVRSSPSPRRSHGTGAYQQPRRRPQSRQGAPRYRRNTPRPPRGPLGAPAGTPHPSQPEHPHPRSEHPTPCPPEPPTPPDGPPTPRRREPPTPVRGTRGTRSAVTPTRSRAGARAGPVRRSTPPRYAAAPTGWARDPLPGRGPVFLTPSGRNEHPTNLVTLKFQRKVGVPNLVTPLVTPLVTGLFVGITLIHGVM